MAKLVKREYRTPFILVTLLFFIWGFARAIMDVLNKHFQMEMGISISQSTWVQGTFFLGYFLFALPAGRFLMKYGYHKGMVFGLSLFALGALTFGLGSFLFVEGTVPLFYFFLVTLFVIASGLVMLEIAANPFVTYLGDKESAASRLNFAQSFNGLGNIFGPWIGGLLLFSGNDGDITLPYLCFGILVTLATLAFLRVKLPEIHKEESGMVEDVHSLWQHKLFLFGFVALMFYEIAEISINSLFINYAEGVQGIDKLTASQWLSFGFLLFMCARFVGSWVMSKIEAERVLLFCAIGTVVANALVLMNLGKASMIALMLNFVFEAIMFPTIFTFALRGLGKRTKQASSILMMSTIGGAIGTMLMGVIGDRTSLSVAFIIPLIGYIVVMAYSWRVNSLISGQAPRRKL
ncbi:MAG: MFS transporter [Bacteroidaceae bacterium]|jgi:FHS family L-fucose permease-like MFS transporter|nr:MFS transporter [Bacteroidaceae bacterium]